MNDWELLSRFAERRDQQAFGELVSRHAGMVYGTCRKRLRDAHLAEDVMQAVFLLLSRRPPSQGRARGASSVAGWLYQTAVYACNNAMRIRRTRQRHEEAAAKLKSSAVASGESIHPGHASDQEFAVDAAMSELSPADRDVLLARFYEGHDVAAIGAALPIEPNTAAKRLSRAVDRLRKLVSKRGIHLTAAALGSAVAEFTRETASAGMITNITSVATGSVPASAASISIYEGVCAMIRMSQMKFAAAAVVVVLAVAGGGVGILTFGRLFAQQTSPSGSPRAVVQTARADPPASAPAAAAAGIDQSDPKAALRAFASAIRAGNLDAMRTLVHATDDGDRQLLDAALNYVKASTDLKDAVKSKFGEQAAQTLAQRMPRSPIDNFAALIESEMEAAVVTTDGDFATVTPGDPSNTMVLYRDGSRWTISAARMTADWTPEQRTQRMGMVNGASEMLGALTEEINSGRIASMNDLAEAIQQIMRGR